MKIKVKVYEKIVAESVFEVAQQGVAALEGGLAIEWSEGVPYKVSYI